MTKRRTCTVRENGAVLAVKNRFELLQILLKYVISERLFSCLHSFRSPTVGHLYAYAGSIVGHLPQFQNQKTKSRQMPGGDGRTWN